MRRLLIASAVAFATAVTPLASAQTLRVVMHSDVKVLDLRPALIQGKAREQVYFKTDSHWNYLGATIGYDALIDAVKAQVPSVPAVAASRPPYVPGVDYYAGDLGRMMGLPATTALP